MSAAVVSVRGRAIRIIGWVLFVIIAIVWGFLPMAGLSPQITERLGSGIAYLLPLLLAAIGAGVLVLKTQAAERRFWMLFSAAMGTLLLPEVYWTWYITVIDPRGPQLPAFYEVLQVVAAVLLIAMFISMTTFGRANVVTRVRVYLDVYAAMIIGWFVVYLTWTLPLFSDVPRGGWNVAAIAAIYPVVGVTFVLMALVIFGGWKAERWRSWERLIAGSFGIYGLGLCAFPAWYAGLLVAVEPLEPSWFTLVLGFGYYLLFMAMVYRATGGVQAQVEQWPMPSPPARWLPVVYPVVIGLVLPFLGWAALAMGSGPGGLPVSVAAFSLAFVLISRSWLSALERAHHRALAITDPVSGAYNHRSLHESLADDLLRAANARQELAVVVLDIDDFKGINNARGHEAGDRLLREVAVATQLAFGSLAKVFRFGSDEFVAVVPGISADDATAMTRSLQFRAKRDTDYGGIELGLSAGIAMFPLHGSDGEQLLSRALAAQQLAKVADADDVIVYDERIVGAVDPFERLARARQRARSATIRALAAAVDARDSATRNHSENVAELASALAQVLGMSEQQCKVVELASRLHDIGKIGVSDAVLVKGEALSSADRAQIEEHPVLGERILAPAGLDEILPAVRHHHECWDGTGYPDGLRGPQIPLEARVLCVCDAFEAMTSARSYRDALSISDALRAIEGKSGTQFDPEVAAAFSRMVMHLHGYAARDKAERLGQDAVVVDRGVTDVQV